MNEFKRLRKKNLGITQKELAKLWGVSERTIRRYENNPKTIEILYLSHYIIPKYYESIKLENKKEKLNDKIKI